MSSSGVGVVCGVVIGVSGVGLVVSCWCGGGGRLGDGGEEVKGVENKKTKSKYDHLEVEMLKDKLAKKDVVLRSMLASVRSADEKLLSNWLHSGGVVIMSPRNIREIFVFLVLGIVW